MLLRINGSRWAHSNCWTGTLTGNYPPKDSESDNNLDIKRSFKRLFQGRTVVNSTAKVRPSVFDRPIDVDMTFEIYWRWRVYEFSTTADSPAPFRLNTMPNLLLPRPTVHCTSCGFMEFVDGDAAFESEKSQTARPRTDGGVACVFHRPCWFVDSSTWIKSRSPGVSPAIVSRRPVYKSLLFVWLVRPRQVKLVSITGADPVRTTWRTNIRHAENTLPV